MAMDQLTRAVIRSFFRSYLVGANFNTRGMQNLGLAYAMYPGLAAIHKDPARLRQAMKRYVRHYNSHPFWAPCLVGIFLSTEARIASGTFPPAMLDKVKDRTTYTLSAIGDSVFAGSLLIFWALSSACLLLAGQAELLLDDPGVEYEPGVVVAGLGDVGQRAEGVEAGVQRPGQPAAGGVQPQ